MDTPFPGRPAAGPPAPPDPELDSGTLVRVLLALNAIAAAALLAARAG